MKMIKCQFCGKEIKNKRHEGLCGKNPQRRGIKKGGKHHNDKTAAKPPIKEAGTGQPASAAESHKLKVVNLKQEYDKNMETLNPKEKSKGKEKKYQCGACGCMFDNLNDGKCPDCGEQLQ